MDEDKGIDSVFVFGGTTSVGEGLGLGSLRYC